MPSTAPRSPPHFLDGGVRHTETASAAVYRALRREIVWLERKPGRANRRKDIALAQGVSRTPVREALLRLVGEGLVDTIPEVRDDGCADPLTKLPEAIVVRKALEQVTAGAAATRATPQRRDQSASDSRAATRGGRRRRSQNSIGRTRRFTLRSRRSAATRNLGVDPIGEDAGRPLSSAHASRSQGESRESSKSTRRS